MENVGIALAELIATAKAFDAGHTPIVGAVTGMMVMAVSRFLLK